MAPNRFCCGFLLVVTVFFASAPPYMQTQAKTLDPAELGALRIIAERLNKTDWDFSVDPCSPKGNWKTENQTKGFENTVDCDCSFTDSCRITSLLMKGQNLSGGLPAEISKFRHLQQLDLSRNVLTGSVPPHWANLVSLTNLSLMGNRLSGPFPLALTKITSLTNLSIEANRFSGPIPSDIGNLVNMTSLTLSANEFNGELPSALAKLTNLTDLRLSSNNFSGKIPDFITNMTKLTKLQIQGTFLEGPIPSGIAVLTNLVDLRITDLRGDGSDFPDLSGMSSMKTMMLRNCKIHGSLPPFIGNMKKLKYLDVSFNQLTGEIPSIFSNMGKVDNIYLTGNMLTGIIPSWILKTNKIVDTTYNNFTIVSSDPTQCLPGSLNVIESYSPAVNSITRVKPCLKRHFPCSSSSSQYHSLHINCGGKETIVDGTIYDQDTEEKGASMISMVSNLNWAVISAGNFMDDDRMSDNYIARNTSAFSMPNSELYTSARLSPLSLTYYGLCMLNGDYTVKLHFAETFFTNDSTFTSLGKRVFNVYVQGRLVLQDFNIADAAGGPGKPTIKTFLTSISDSTLNIQFYWAGKGTTGIPTRGVYGPLVSAISVTSNFEPPTESGYNHRRIQIAIWVSFLSLLLILTLSGICWWRRWRETFSISRDLGGLDLQNGSFSLRQIKAATRNFDASNKIGEGGFGSVYKGLLSEGTVVAVKQLSSRSKQGNREFVNEIGMISALQHPNLVKLHGCCVEGNQLLLIYEYMENNCLSRALFGSDPQLKLKLDWPTRRKICIGIARGLTYLHEESRLKIIHRDIKASNVLLDNNLNAKISDFGLAKLNEEDRSHISTRVAGTIGYIAPEYAMRGCLTTKADIYSFGVVALEIVSGKSNTNYRPKEEFVYLLDWACVLQEKGTLLELVDPELGSEYCEEEALLMLNVALLCTNASPTLRPSMSKVVSLLEGQTPLQPLLSYLSFSANRSSTTGMRRCFWQNPDESQTVSISAFYADSSPNSSGQENEASIILAKASPNTIC